MFRRWSAGFIACVIFMAVFVSPLSALASAPDLSVSYFRLSAYSDSAPAAEKGRWTTLYESQGRSVPFSVDMSAGSNQFLQFAFSCNPYIAPAGSQVFLDFRWTVVTDATNFGYSAGIVTSAGTFFGSPDSSKYYWSSLSNSVFPTSGFQGYSATCSYRFDAIEAVPVEGQVSFVLVNATNTWQTLTISSLYVLTPDGQIIYILGNLSDKIDNVAGSIVSAANKIIASQDTNTNKITANQDANAQNVMANQNANADKITSNQDSNTNKITANQNANAQNVMANQNANTDKLANGWDSGQMSSDNGKLSGALGELDGLQASADAGLNDALSNQTSPDLSDHTESVTFITSSAVLFWNALGPFQIVIYLILALVVFNFLSRYQSGGG